MAELDRILSDAVAAEHMPFVVGMAGNSAGVTWSGAAGDARTGMPAQVDTVFRIFSMTKAVGSTAAMILMDRGKLKAETPVAEILPEFAEKQVLDGFNADGSPRMRPPRTQATVRHLATHTSGLVYEFWNTDMPRYMQATGLPTILSGLRTGLDYPLLFDPGTRWDYGIGIDWLGQVVEKVDGRTIDRFCREEILEPLGMKDTRFEAEADLAPRLASVRMRGEDGHFGDFELAPPAKPAFYGMGHTLYSTAPDYMRFLRMYLNRGQLDGRRILSEAGLASMLANQIGNTAIPMLKTAAPPVTADAEFFPGRRKSHSMAFERIEEDVPGMRSAGSQFWAGVCNTHCWFDPAKDLAGIFMTQTLPFVEPRFMGAYEAFEKGVYRAVGR
ncbi:MAG: beta-lactamase family protein [Rhizobacter sp.]|nr:beta-lactamase family protein [Rhizobacter sp.]